MNNSEYWTDYWIKDGQEGEVFVDKHGSKPAYIREFWEEALKSVDNEAKILDVACGGGSIYEIFSAERREALNLTASDLSQAALDLLSKRLPEVTTVACSADDMPFESETFDVLVSQFGIEYAGFSAFTEAMRLLAPGGSFTFLCHLSEGYIDKRNQSFLVGATTALTSGFIPAANTLINASFGGDKNEIVEAKETFKEAQQPIADILKEHSSGIHHHLYFGFREMYLKYGNYRKEDILTWLSDMEADIRKNIEKVTQIRKVSLDDDRVKIVEERLRAGGLSHLEIKPFAIPKRPDDHVALAISGQKVQA